MNDVITYSGLSLGVIGVVLTIYYYKKSKVKKILGCTIQNFPIINKSWGKIEKLRFAYDLENIDNLTISDIYFWNKGNRTIEKTDMVTLSPLQLKVKDTYKILDAFITQTNENSNNWSLEKKETQIEVNMDYVDPRQGCRITVYHTGTALILDGKIKGG